MKNLSGQPGYRDKNITGFSRSAIPPFRLPPTSIIPGTYFVPGFAALGQKHFLYKNYLYVFN